MRGQKRRTRRGKRRLRATVSRAKARMILHDKSVKGHPLTAKQRRFFGAVASGTVRKRSKRKSLNPKSRTGMY